MPNLVLAVTHQPNNNDQLAEYRSLMRASLLAIDVITSF
jgi:hypothetical protein